MDYYKSYKQLIRKARDRQLNNPESLLGIYTEQHHIIPKCVMVSRGKSSKIYNAKWNIVKLTAREHFIAHMLLWKSCNQHYGEHHRWTHKMLYAIHQFTTRTSKNYNHKITARTFAHIREKASIMISARQTGRKGISLYGEDNPNFGNNWSQKQKDTLSIKLKGRTSFRKGKSYPQVQGNKNGNWGKRGEDCPAIKLRKTYRFYHEDGRVVEFSGIAKYARENGYNAGNLNGVRTGKLKRTKDIIKVELIHS